MAAGKTRKARKRVAMNTAPMKTRKMVIMRFSLRFRSKEESFFTRREAVWARLR